MQLYVRDALESDVEELIALLLGGKVDGATHPDIADARYLGDYIDALREIDRTDGSYLIVAELGGRLVGMLQLITFRHLQHRGGRCAEIESMHVAADERARGIGGQLIDYAVARARDLGCYRIQLTSNAARDGAHRFYESHEFEATHRGYKRYLDLDWTPNRSAGRRSVDATSTV